MSSRPTRGAILILLTALTAGCYEIESRVTQTVDKSWDAANLEILDLETVNGRVEIRGAAVDQVRVRAEIRSSHETEEEIIRFETVDGVLRVREKWSRRGRGIFPFHVGDHGSVRYEIEVPERFEIELSTTNGRVETYGVRGEHLVTSVNGRIEIETPDAEVNARTVNGRIEARFTRNFQGANLKTVNGSVRVYVPSGTRVAADIDQVNGSFNSRLPVVVNARGSADGVPLRVTTVNGSVTLDEIEMATDDSESVDPEDL